MRILITGSRDWYCPSLAQAVIDHLIRKYGPDLTIVHGAARGVDRAFAEAAAAAGVAVEAYAADWDTYGKSAGIRRNAVMVATGAALCLAFSPHIRQSRGTGDCAGKAHRAGIATWVIAGEGVKAVRYDPKVHGLREP